MASILIVAQKMSGLQLLWTGLSGAYVVRGLVGGLTGHTGVEGDIQGEKGLLRFNKRPVRRLMLGLTLNTVGLVAVIRHYSFGQPNFHWLQVILDQLSIPTTVQTDKLSTIMGCGLLLTHTLWRIQGSMYVSVFSSTTQDLMEYLCQHTYTLLAFLTILSEAPSLGAPSSDPWFSWSIVEYRHDIGIVLFGLVMFLDGRLQQLLTKVRRNKAGHIVSEDHKIPQGGLFEYAACPHFLTEILAHVAIGLTLGFHHQTWWMCTGYVAVSHACRALARRQWYRKSFKDFPSCRKAIIPYLL